MISVLIFCHDKRESDFFGRLCRECVKFIEKEFLYNFIISDMDYKKEIENINTPELMIIEVTDINDLERVKYMRSVFTNARLLLLANNHISPEYYVVPEISPDALLLKPYVYSTATKSIHKLLLWCYRDRERSLEKEMLMKIQTGGEVYYCNYTEVHYLEARDKKIVVHMHENEIAFYDSLQRLEKCLPEYFIRCHRSYIVNFMFIQKISLTDSEFYLNEKTVIPISQKYRIKLAKILQKYKNSQVNLG